MDVAQMLFKNNNTLLFRKQQELNFLQSILMWLFNTIPEKLAANKQYSRKQMLCHQFADGSAAAAKLAADGNDMFFH